MNYGVISSALLFGPQNPTKRMDVAFGLLLLQSFSELKSDTTVSPQAMWTFAKYLIVADTRLNVRNQRKWANKEVLHYVFGKFYAVGVFRTFLELSENAGLAEPTTLQVANLRLCAKYFGRLFVNSLALKEKQYRFTRDNIVLELNDSCEKVNSQLAYVRALNSRS